MTTALGHFAKSKANFAGVLQARMDEITVLWEYVSSSSGSDRDSANSSDASSSFYLDFRDQVSMRLSQDVKKKYGSRSYV